MDNSSLMFDSSVCRICLEKSTECKDLFNEDKDSKDILNNIYLCFQIILNQEKYLPVTICKICTEELNAANRFRIKCVTFEDRFTTYCNQKNDKNLLSENLSLPGFKNIEDNDQNGYEESWDSNYESAISNSNLNSSFKCEICGKILKTKTSLIKHGVSFHKNRKQIGTVSGFGANRRFHCTKCSYSTPRSQTLVSHMRRHNGERPFKCECGKSFTQLSSLTAHRKTHSDTTYYTCSVCGKQFKHAFTLRNHLRVHDTAKFICHICQKALKSKNTLKEHILRHSDIRNYNCEDCGDTFVTCSELLNHKKTHKVDKDMECHLCAYRTHTKKNLVTHIKRHAGKTVSCKLCDITCYTKTDLKCHERVHTRDKPFQCPTCVQRFTHSTSLNKHMQTVHGLNYKWSEYKGKESSRRLKLVKDEKL